MYIYNNVYMQNCCTFVCIIKKNASFYQKKRLIVCEIIFIFYFCSRKQYLITLKTETNMNNAQFILWWWRSSRFKKS